jgi:hypothetical protein
VVVDNGSDPAAIEVLSKLDGIILLRPART